MYKNPQSLIRQVIEFECPICLEIYDQHAKFPMIMCQQQHTCCLACLDNVLFKGKTQNQTISCPFCKETIARKDAIKFRMLNQIRVTAKQMKMQGSIIRNNMKQLNQEKGTLQNQLRAEREKNEWLIQQIQHAKKHHLLLLQENQILKQQLKVQQEKYNQMKIEQSQVHQQFQRLKTSLIFDTTTFDKIKERTEKSLQNFEISQRRLKQTLEQYKQDHNLLAYSYVRETLKCAKTQDKGQKGEEQKQLRKSRRLRIFIHQQQTPNRNQQKCRTNTNNKGSQILAKHQ